MSRASRSATALAAAAQPAKIAASKVRLITAPAAVAVPAAASDRKRKRGSDATSAEASIPAASTSPVVVASKPKPIRASRKKAAASTPAAAADDSAMVDAPEDASAAAAVSSKAAVASTKSKPKASPKKKGGKGKAAAAAAAALLESTDGFKFGTLSRDFERALTTEGKGVHFVGVDEAGRGPLAGPVVCAAVWAPLDRVDIKGVNDSKKMSESERERVYAKLTSHPHVVWATSILEHDEIDRINILEATMRGMERAVAGVVAKMEEARQKEATKGGKKQQAGSSAAAAGVSLPASLDLVLVDGNRIPPGLGATAAPPLSIPSQFVIKGDAICYSIAAASVIAKVTRDRIMMQHHNTWPQYNFAQHKGYGVGAHMSAIYKHGPCPIHRMTFAPMKHMKTKAAPTTNKEEQEAEAEEEEEEDKVVTAAKKRKAAVTKKTAAAAEAASKPQKKKTNAPAASTSKE